VALSNKGRQISFLGILDTNGPSEAASVLSFAEKVRGFWSGLKRIYKPEQLAYSLAKRLTRGRGMKLLRLVARAQWIRVPDEFAFHMQVHLRTRLVGAFGRNWYESTSRSLPPLHAPGFLFRAVEQESGMPQDLGWRRHLPEIEIIDVQGDHQTMLESPNLPLLREEFLRALDRASRISTTDPSATKCRIPLKFAECPFNGSSDDV
jgi:thioesterase domain-containing protein